MKKSKDPCYKDIMSKKSTKTEISNNDWVVVPKHSRNNKAITSITPTQTLFAMHEPLFS